MRRNLVAQPLHRQNRVHGVGGAVVRRWKGHGPGRCAYVERGMSIPLLGLIGGDSQLTNVLRNASGSISGMCAAPLTFSDDRQHDSEIVIIINSEWR